MVIKERTRKLNKRRIGDDKGMLLEVEYMKNTNCKKINKPKVKDSRNTNNDEEKKQAMANKRNTDNEKEPEVESKRNIKDNQRTKSEAKDKITIAYE